LPILQRLLEGIEETATLFAVPHTPFTAGGAPTVTVTLCDEVPPTPVQSSVYVVVVVSTPVATVLPVVALTPVHPFDAAQEVAFAADQFNVVPVLYATEGEVAEKVITGRGALFALHDAVPPPFAPTQLQFQGPVPVTDEALPAAQKFVAGIEETVLPLADPHEPTTGEEAEATVTVTLCDVDPPAPVQFTVYVVVVVRFPVANDPDVPDCPEEREQEVVFAELQVIVVGVLYAMEVAAAEIEAVGVDG
jgi:hypothetical protein